MADKTFTASAQSVLTSLATAAIAWLAYSVQENNTQIAVLSSKVDRLERGVFNTAYIGPDIPTPLAPHRLPANTTHYALPVTAPEPRRK